MSNWNSMSVYCICGSILILKTDYCTREIAKLSLGGIFVFPSTFKQNQFSQRCQRVREISIFKNIFNNYFQKTFGKPSPNLMSLIRLKERMSLSKFKLLVVIRKNCPKSNSLKENGTS